MSDSTFSRPTSHLAGAALTRQMFRKPPTAVFVLCCSLGNSDNSVICILFHPPPPPPPPCQGVKFIFACAQRLIGSGWRRRSNLSPTIGKASPQSRSTQSRLFPQFPNAGLDPICQRSNLLSLFIYLPLYFHRRPVRGAAFEPCCVEALLLDSFFVLC